MLNSVELVLMFLSMLPSLSHRNIKAVDFLLSLSCQYGMLGLMFMIVNYGIGDLAMEHIDTLFALAQCNGYDTEGLDKYDMTMEDMCGILESIIKPIVGRMEASLAEISILRQTQAGGEEVLKLPLDELKTLVKNWTRSAREDNEEYKRFSKSVEMQLDDLEVTKAETQLLARVERPTNETLSAWSNMAMDDKTAAAVLDYCNEYAAAPLGTQLKRSARVDKQKHRATEDRDGGIQSFDSFTTDSSGMCIGFSMSFRTICYSTKPRKTTASEEPVSSGSQAPGPSSHSEYQIGMSTPADNIEYVDATVEESNISYDDEASNNNTSRELPQSMSISTLEARWEHLTNPPSLVGYYMRWEMHVTKHGMPRPAPVISTAPRESPVPGMTIEEVYESYADSWEAAQHDLWLHSLHNSSQQYTGMGAVELGFEPEEEYVAQTEETSTQASAKSSVMAKAMQSAYSRIREIFKF